VTVSPLATRSTPRRLSVFQRKWQSLPQYQQTRAHLAYSRNGSSASTPPTTSQARAEPLITLGSAPLEDRSFRATILASSANRA